MHSQLMVLGMRSTKILFQNISLRKERSGWGLPDIFVYYKAFKVIKMIE